MKSANNGQLLGGESGWYSTSDEAIKDVKSKILESK